MREPMRLGAGVNDGWRERKWLYISIAIEPLSILVADLRSVLMAIVWDLGEGADVSKIPSKPLGVMSLINEPDEKTTRCRLKERERRRPWMAEVVALGDFRIFPSSMSAEGSFCCRSG